MSQLQRLQSENQQLRVDYEQLERQYAELEMDLEAAYQTITELEIELDRRGDEVESVVQIRAEQK